MAGYLAMTDARWAGLLQSLRYTDGINFWSPSNKSLRNDIAGCQIYFYAEPLGFPKRKVSGFGTVRNFEMTFVSEAWSKYEDKNGAKTLSIFVKLLKDDRLKTVGSRPLLESSLIACHTIDAVQWLPDPIELDDLDIVIKRGVQRGRTLTSGEEAKLNRACLKQLREGGVR